MIVVACNCSAYDGMSFRPRLLAYPADSFLQSVAYRMGISFAVCLLSDLMLTKRLVTG